MEAARKQILGYFIDLLTFDEAVEKTKKAIELRNKLHIITINPEIIETANKNQELSQLIHNSELVIPESAGIKLALKLKGINQEQIPGIDFAKRIIAECDKNNYSIALIGAEEDVIQKACINLNNEFKNLKISYIQNGYFSGEQEDKIIENLKNSGARFIAVALGVPKQELFIKRCMEKYPDAVYIGIGGAFDVWAGKVERAPKFFRAIGCEWFYRTITQPKRIKRVYKTLPIYLFKIIIEAIQKK